MNNGATGLSMYGAVTGSVAILLSGLTVWWTIHRDRQANRVKVEVTLRAGIAGLGSGAVEVLMIKAVNRSAFGVTVTGAGLRMPDGKSWFAITAPLAPFRGLPVDLDAKTGTTEILLRWDAVPGFDPKQPQQASVTLRSGETFSSPLKPMAAKH